MRQDSTARLSYECEEEAKETRAAGKERQSARRNPYLMDYEKARSGQSATKKLSLDWYPQADSGRERRRGLDVVGRRSGVSSFQTAGRRAASQGRASAQANQQPRAKRQEGAGYYPGQRADRQTVRPIAIERPAGRPARTACQGEPNARRMAMERQKNTVQENAAKRRVRENTAQRNAVWNRHDPEQKGSLTAVRTQRKPSAVRSQSQIRSQAALRRRQRVIMQRVAVGLWALCILVLAVIFVIRNDQVSAAGGEAKNSQFAANRQEEPAAAGNFVQGLSAEVYAKHPDWTENFLTPNEYSRPGEALESVKNIFVHYTANPGTSAAQNRSYFEQQKDTHEASVSAHFIIGYEGEIIQCVPLDEIAYAVMTRNYDSISIECCFLAQDGSFTQETYDSLISLLAWLTDAYELDANDILRHYDCGGKKCPIYYTEHPGEWEQLKKDVQSKKDMDNL